MKGRVWRQSYNPGLPEAPLMKGEATDKTGTTVVLGGWRHLEDDALRL